MKTIHHVLEIAAPEATAWAALTEPGPIAGWWSTEDAGGAADERPA